MFAELELHSHFCVLLMFCPLSLEILGVQKHLTTRQCMSNHYFRLNSDYCSHIFTCEPKAQLQIKTMRYQPTATAAATQTATATDTDRWWWCWWWWIFVSNSRSSKATPQCFYLVCFTAGKRDACMNLIRLFTITNGLLRSKILYVLLSMLVL